MVRHGGSSAGSYLADPTYTIPSHCASIVVTSTVRVNCLFQLNVTDFATRLKAWACYGFKELGDKMGNGLGATTKNVLTRPEFETNPIAVSVLHSLDRGHS